jgi:hypothetical protein
MPAAATAADDLVTAAATAADDLVTAAATAASAATDQVAAAAAAAMDDHTPAANGRMTPAAAPGSPAHDPNLPIRRSRTARLKLDNLEVTI